MRYMFTNREYQPFFRSSLGTLLHGDCMEIMPAIRPGIFDLILCDLPYGITDLEWDKRIPMEPLWREYWRLLKPNGTVVLTAQQPFATDLIQAARKLFRYELIWEKNCALGFLNAKKMPLRAHENILVFYRVLPVYNPQMVPGTPYRRRYGARKGGIYRPTSGGETRNDGFRYPRSVLRFANGRKTAHPTEKPLELFEWVVKTYTNSRGLVLDNCLGSGTTAAACEKSGRRWLGIERNEDYCRMAVERLEGKEEENADTG